MTVDDEPSEAELLARIHAGERDAFAVLVRRHGPVARRTAALLGAGPDTDDVVQEAFVKAYRALGGFRDGAEFRPWVLRIVANETRNAQRSGRRRALRERSPAAVPDDLLPGVSAAADPAEQAVTAERLVELRRALLGLPERQRRVVICRYLLELDEAETAVVLGLARGTVKSRTHRAIERMRRDLTGWPARTAPGQDDRVGEEAGHG